MLAAAQTAMLPLAAPAPSVSCTGLHGDGAVYSVSFSVASSEILSTARTEILTQIHRHLHFAGIALAVAGTTNPNRITVPTPAEILAQSDLFGMLQDQERALLATHFEAIWLEPDDPLFVEGAAPAFLFLVASGVIEITKMGKAGPRVVHRMSPGESLGAVGLITGAHYAATAKALTRAKLFRLDKGAMAAAIAVAPQLAAGLEQLAHRGQEALARDAAANEPHPTEHPDELRFRLRKFLRLLAS